MYEVFKYRPAINKGQPLIPEYTYIKNGLRRENAKIVKYYRENPTAVNASHLLVKIIDSICVPYGTDPYLHFGQVKDIAFNIGSAMGLTSPIFKGRVHENSWFYGKGCKELILVTTDDFDMSDIDNTWQDLRPIRVLQHGMTQIAPPVLDGKRQHQIGGYVVIEINIPMLSCQYQAWRKAVVQKQIAPLGVVHFVRSYPIVNMIYSHQDYALFNRLSALDRGEPVAAFKNPHSFPVLDYTDTLDTVLDKYIHFLKQRRVDMHTMLAMLPAVNNHDMLDTMLLPQLPSTRQVDWLLELSRLPAIAFILRKDAENNNASNTETKGHWRMSLREWYSDKTISGVVGYLNYGKIEAYVNTNIKPYLK